MPLPVPDEGWPSYTCIRGSLRPIARTKFAHAVINAGFLFLCFYFYFIDMLRPTHLITSVNALIRMRLGKCVQKDFTPSSTSHPPRRCLWPLPVFSPDPSGRRLVRSLRFLSQCSAVAVGQMFSSVACGVRALFRSLIALCSEPLPERSSRVKRNGRCLARPVCPRPSGLDE